MAKTVREALIEVSEHYKTTLIGWDAVDRICAAHNISPDDIVETEDD